MRPSQNRDGKQSEMDNIILTEVPKRTYQGQGASTAVPHLPLERP